VRHLHAAAVTAIGVVVAVIVLAVVLRPLLPWLFAVFIFGAVVRLALRD